jgi:hypothetical protein
VKPTHGLIIGAAALALAAAASAQYPTGGWGGPGWGGMGPYPGEYGPRARGRDPREGKVEAAHFVAASPKVAELGHGTIVLAPGPGGISGGPAAGAFETALADQLARAGYRTDAPQPGSGQVAEFVVSRDLAAPPDPPHSPVTGGVALGAGNRGSGLGLGLSIDLSKPRGPLVATRVEARIRDSASQELLWQGRAEVLTREGDKHWTDPLVAARLAEALFKDFPRPSR